MQSTYKYFYFTLLNLLDNFLFLIRTPSTAHKKTLEIIKRKYQINNYSIIFR